MKKNIVILNSIVALLIAFGCSGRGEMFSKADRTRSSGGIAYNESIASAARSESQDALGYMDTPNMYGAIQQSESPPSSNYANSFSTERKLVKQAYINIRVENLTSTDDSLSDLMKKYGAYAASTDIQENSRHYTIRVPAPKYEAFLGETDGMGRILRRTENTEDVTLYYYDLEGRLATKKELLKTYQSYLGKASNIEDILSVEARIADLQNDIERTGTQFRNLANTVDYATIELYLLGPAASRPYQVSTFGERIKELIGGFNGFLSTVGVIIAGIVIYGIPVLLLLAFLVWVLFGRIGLMKKLWQIVTSKPPALSKKEGD